MTDSLFSRRRLVGGLAAGATLLGASEPAAAAAACAAAPAPGAAGVQRGYLTVGGRQVHYRVAHGRGRARPLLLLHPSPLSGEVWEFFMREIGRDRTVVAPDTPGYGQSDPPAQPPGIADYAAAMHDFLRAMRLGRCDVMGYHTGSAIAVEMAHQQPRRVASLVLVGLGLYTDAELAAARAGYAPRPVGDRPALLAKRWPSFREQGWRMTCGDARALNILLESHRNADRSQWGFAASQSYPLGARLGALDARVLVLCPEDDLWHNTRRAQALLRNGRLDELPGWTHGFLDEKATEVAQRVRAFTDAV